MRRLHFIFGIAILVAALTLAMAIVFQPRKRGGSAEQARPAEDLLEGVAERTKRLRADREIRPERREPAVVWVRSADPRLMEQAQEVESAARQRLGALTEQLALTRDQQARIFPLLARSAPTYDESLEIVGDHGTKGRLTPADAEAGIHEVLDPGQQEELIETLAEKDLWWADLMVRLERDLVRSTEPADAGAAPVEEGAVEPAPHQGGNLFDMMDHEGR